jgi:hypothetical protein
LGGKEPRLGSYLRIIGWYEILLPARVLETSAASQGSQMPANQFPEDFADAVCSELSRRASFCPQREIIVALFESMYFASLKTEESQPVIFHIVYLDPANPDPDPPERIVKDRWSSVKLAKTIPVTIPNLIKIAKASDP